MASPDLIVGYESALDYWRAARVAGTGPGLEPEGRVFGARTLTLSEQARRAADTCCTEVPLDVVVHDRNERHGCRLVHDHVFKGPIGKRGVTSLESGARVCAVPVVFTQLAASWDQIDLALLACEVCGEFGITPSSRDSFEGGLKPLATIAELKAYAGNAQSLGVRGGAAAQQALELAAQGCASPREAEVAVFLSSSRRKGGADLGNFKVNEPIAIPARLRRILNSAKLKPDFLWEEPRLILEYDSNEFHLTAMQKERDEARRRVFEELGYSVKTLTNDILLDNVKLNAFIEELEGILSPRRREAGQAMLLKREELRERLFGRESMRAIRDRLAH